MRFSVLYHGHLPPSSGPQEVSRQPASATLFEAPYQDQLEIPLFCQSPPFPVTLKSPLKAPLKVTLEPPLSVTAVFSCEVVRVDHFFGGVTDNFLGPIGCRVELHIPHKGHIGW